MPVKIPEAGCQVTDSGYEGRSWRSTRNGGTPVGLDTAIPSSPPLTRDVTGHFRATGVILQSGKTTVAQRVSFETNNKANVA